jgi:hypothetical protein
MASHLHSAVGEILRYQDSKLIKCAKLFARLYDRGHSIQFHETLLAQFEGTLASLEDHERHLLAELAEATQRP